GESAGTYGWRRIGTRGPRFGTHAALKLQRFTYLSGRIECSPTRLPARIRTNGRSMSRPGLDDGRAVRTAEVGRSIRFPRKLLSPRRPGVTTALSAPGIGVIDKPVLAVQSLEK